MHLLDARTGLELIERDECYRLLAEDEIGRLAVVDGGTPHVVPVNYVLDGDDVVFRTDAGTKLDRAGHGRACFEIDGFDREHRTGWSVVVHGRLEEVTTFEFRLMERMQALDLRPWAGEKSHWLRLVVERVAGRRLTGPVR